MPRFRCDACNSAGTFRYSGHLACPQCGSPEIQIALANSESGDDAEGAEFLAAFCVPNRSEAE